MASRLLLRPRRLAPHLHCCAMPRRACHAPFSAGGDALASAPPSSPRLPRWGWRWDDSLSVDENYLDLAFLLARNSRAPPQVGCVLVAGVDDGGARRRQGVELVCAANSFIATDTQARLRHITSWPPPLQHLQQLHSTPPPPLHHS
ncbi:hypothetical protein AB1Y20_007321 [Prymnesium parvum]|uniref:Uncharacterized protein n=1 Tax=Prymnesium parvum TaxID=97485 RepID=A0AB34IXR7_PRYPA